MSTLISSLTRSSAQAASAAVAFSYVGVLYIFPSARSRPWEIDENGRRLDRLHPDILKARLWAVTFSTATSLVGVGLLIRATAAQGQKMSFSDTARYTLGLTGLTILPDHTYLQYLRILFQPLLLTALLFWGPLHTLLFLEPASKPSPSDPPLLQRLWRELTSIYTVRALIAGPLLEEIVFRGCIMSFHLLVRPAERLSKAQLIFLSPLWFGLAHIHGIWEVYITRGKNRQALVHAGIQTTIQFIYTTIFGWYASFVHLRTGSVLAATLCHTFCNYMGLPPIFDAMERFPHKRLVIATHYVAGLTVFAVLVNKWASDTSLFPVSSLWNTLRS